LTIKNQFPIVRQWKSRIKGRDLYDFIWYLGQGVPCRLKHLEARMRQTGHWIEERPMDRCDLTGRLRDRFESINIDHARNDVAPFIADPNELDLWSPGFFIDRLDEIETL
jgi:hypothetical protein